jgi:serine/threonine protein phosphatase 1
VQTPLVPRIPDSWTVWAFADPHGVASAFEAALSEAGLVDRELRWTAPPRTALIGCGDYIDRGRNSSRLVALLRRLEVEAADAGGRAIFMRGNHEQEMVRVAAGQEGWFDLWLKFGGRTALESFGCTTDIERDQASALRVVESRAPGIFAWLADLPQAVRWRDILFVHAGLPPGAGPEDLGPSTEAHLWVRADFLDASWTSGAFRRFEEAGVHRVVFGHTPMSAGPALFHDARALCIDTDACRNPRLPRHSRSAITLVRLAGDIAFSDARFVVVPTEDAPDRMVPAAAAEPGEPAVRRFLASHPAPRIIDD